MNHLDPACKTELTHFRTKDWAPADRRTRRLTVPLFRNLRGVVVVSVCEDDPSVPPCESGAASDDRS